MYTDRLKNFIGGKLFFIPVFFGIMIFSMIFAMKPVIGALLFIVSLLAVFFTFHLNLGLYSIIFSKHFDNLTRLNLESSLTFTKLLILIVMGLLLLKIFLSKESFPLKNLYNNPLTIAAYIFLIISIASIINAHDLIIYLGQNSRRLNLVLFYLLLVTLLRRFDILKKLFLVFLAGAVIAACLGIFEMATGANIVEIRWGDEVKNASFSTLTNRAILKDQVSSDQLEKIKYFRVFGLTGNPDFHAHSMVMPAILLFLFYFLYKSWIVRALVIFMFFLFFINIVASGARGGVVALFIGCVTYLIFTRMKYKLVFTSALLLVFLALSTAFFIFVPPRVFKRFAFAAETESISFRIGLSEMAISMIQDHPIMGIGTGNFLTDYNRYKVSNAPRSAIYAHNCFLQVWAENGFFGFLAYLGLYLMSFRNVLIVWRGTKEPILREAAVTVLAINMAYIFYACIDPVIENELHWMAFAFSTALLNIHRNRQMKEITV